jgi:hypothetical protein
MTYEYDGKGGAGVHHYVSGAFAPDFRADGAAVPQ